jgi:hypothetical protein
MQAHGTQSPIFGEVKVRVIIRLHLKRIHNNVTNSLSNAHKANTEIYIKAKSSKEKAKMKLLLKDFVLELNTKNLGKSLSFLTITYTTLSARRFRSYKILTLDVAAEFCIQTEQWHNGYSIFSLGLAETPELTNTVSEDNSLSFRMVH